MRKHCKEKVIKLIKSIKQLQVNRNCGEAMLIVDQKTGHLLSAIVHQFFVLGVKNITKISLIKKPEKNSIGIYYISKESIPLIAEDFKKEALYHSINILMCEDITPEIMKQIGSQKKIVERLAFLGELKLNIRYLSSKFALICEDRHLLRALMKNQLKHHTETFANSLMDGIISGYGEYFSIKVYHSTSTFNQEVIKILTRRYEEHLAYLKANSQLLSQEEQITNQKEFKTISLVLVDRKMDIVSPMVRNYYYLTMISDVFDADLTTKEILLREGKKIKFKIDDPILQNYKLMHISKAEQSINPQFMKFQAQNKAAQLKQEKNVNNLQLKHIIRDIPEYNRKVKSFEDQICFLHEIAVLSKEQNLPQLGKIEQMIVSGLNEHGQQTKDKKTLQMVADFFKEKPNHPNYYKILVMLLLCADLDSSDKKKILLQIKEQQLYPELLSFITQMKVVESSFKPRKLKITYKKEKIFLDMHESTIYSVLCDLMEKGNSKLLNLIVIGESKKPASKFEAIVSSQDKEWLICMVGGIGLNEICQLERLQEVYKNISINIMSTELLTSWNCIQRYSSLFQEEVEL